MGLIQSTFLILVIIAILFVVPYFIANLTTKKLLKEKSKGFRITGFIIVLLVSFLLEVFVLGIGALTTFGR